MQGLQNAGRVNNRGSSARGDDQEQGQKLLQQGWLKKITWENDTSCLVPSFSKRDVHHSVDLMTMACTCTRANFGGIYNNYVNL